MWKANTVPLFSGKIGVANNCTNQKNSTSYNPKFPAIFNAVNNNRSLNQDLMHSFTIAGPDLANYEKIKVVGQGSFGVAILYQRKDDRTMVVLKQINLSELTAAEKELAMNEVEVFSKLHHPNIISYLGSFIKDKTLLIEMEYADGGTLSQIIAERVNREHFPERYIIGVFEQISSAINYMHSENILHRDLKTANVFLNQRGIVKIGDFGISKIMNTKIHAQTVLGTPYYFSPEMCEGKEYDHKSDIWALGCILGEMCCLKKTFAASNLSELVTKIMAASYSPIPLGYTSGLKSLLSNLLKVEPSDRPEASEILEYWIPLIFRNLGKLKGYSYDEDINTENLSSTADTLSEPTSQAATNELMIALTAVPVEYLQKRSVLYQLKAFGTSFNLSPIQLPPKACIRCVAASNSHFVAVNDDGSVYAWGEGSFGQLGLSTIDSWKHYPSRLESIRKFNIVGACAGDSFTIFWTNLGKTLSCGNNSKYCLGNEENTIQHNPKIIKNLENVKIVDVSAGLDHVIAISAEGHIYAWGTNVNGALGLGNLITIQKVPQKILISYAKSKPQKVVCGPDTSAILFESGEVYGCGSNAYNKLGFNKIQRIMSFKNIVLPKKVIDFSFSSSHSVFLIEGGYVVTMGKNSEGQRGLGHCHVTLHPTMVASIREKFVKKVQCTDQYTIVTTDDNLLSFWGTRHGIPESNCLPSNSKAGLENGSLFQSTKNNAQVDMEIANNTVAFTNFLASMYKSELILKPIDILALYSSPDQQERGYFVELINVYPLPQSILVLVNTTSPLVSSAEDL